MECEISAVSGDWANKGCHVHVGRAEVSIHPDHLGGVCFRLIRGREQERDAAFAVVRQCLGDPRFRRQLRSAVDRAREYMPSVEGHFATKARGRMREFKYLVLALDRMGETSWHHSKSFLGRGVSAASPRV
jgi:hypothetical protein